MGSERFFSELLFIVLWLYVLLAWAWPYMRLRRGPLGKAGHDFLYPSADLT